MKSVAADQIKHACQNYLGGPGPPGPSRCYSTVLNCILLHDNIFVSVELNDILITSLSLLNLILNNQRTFKTLLVNETSIIFPEDLELFPVVL